ncbi:Ternary complex factor MIP1, leucine-zipper [Melia azedarach]|uniref:Ternary complex factor MIP1, leucine-zipper n=1 Tax=Melia azedarach TaxID=155640 RepID=A0ACC1XZ93_MELAZ|nr:Ternary complex factor MIP1, leucine-zipper [Melia azedarach]
MYWRGGSSLKPFMFLEARVSRHYSSNSNSSKRKAEEAKVDSKHDASNSLKMKEMGQHEHCDEFRKNQTPRTEVQNSLKEEKEMGQHEQFDEFKKSQTPRTKVQNLLKQEILQLHENLNDQFLVRDAFEKALSHRPLSLDTVTDKSIPKDAKELIKEIAVLELEVKYLEQYLLSLYRQNFNERLSSLSNADERMKSSTVTQGAMFSGVSQIDSTSEKENSVIRTSNPISCGYSSGNSLKECNDNWQPQNLLDAGIHRSHSSLSQHSACSIRTSPPLKSLAKAVDSYHSLPLSMLEQAPADTSGGISLAEHLGTCISDHIPETPNWLSEEMIKCISDIFCELADPPLMNHDCPLSPISYSSSPDVLSSQGQSDIWSPRCGKFSSFNSHFDNPFSIGESEEFNGPYSTLAKVEKICRDDQKLKDIEHKLQYYRSLIYRLEEVDLRRMKHEQKLAFWINVHNSLVMHAYLVYGIPKNHLKRISLLLKAAYNVGGQTINIDMIQSSILGCRMPRPGQWLRFLFSSKAKFKVGDARRAFTIEHQEPRLHFALCSGSYSDPVVRIYTPKRVFQDLETAKEEYIQSNFSINKEHKILLPKIVESFAKDSEMCSAGLLEMIEQIFPASQRKNIQQCQHKKSGKIIEWVPHNFAVRFLLSKELA